MEVKRRISSPYTPPQWSCTCFAHDCPPTHSLENLRKHYHVFEICKHPFDMQILKLKMFHDVPPCMIYSMAKLNPSWSLLFCIFQIYILVWAFFHTVIFWEILVQNKLHMCPSTGEFISYRNLKWFHHMTLTCISCSMLTEDHDTRHSISCVECLWWQDCCFYWLPPL